MKTKNIKGYEAIFIEEINTIECQLNFGNRYSYDLLAHYITDCDSDGIPENINISNNLFADIRIGYCSHYFKKMIDNKNLRKCVKKETITMKISNFNSSLKHFDILNKIGLSVLFSIANKFRINLTLLHDQPYDISAFLSFNYNIANIEMKSPTIEKTYEVKPLKYYLNANLCDELPFYQFLQYYHCLEYYFEKYKGSRLKKTIKSGIDNFKKDLEDFEPISDLLYTISTHSDKDRKELSSLKDVLSEVKAETVLNEFLENRPELKLYFIDSTDYETVTKQSIMTDKVISSDNVAKRIYQIRNAIVHAKAGRKKLILDGKTIKALRKDIQLLRYISKEVLRQNAD